MMNIEKIRARFSPDAKITESMAGGIIIAGAVTLEMDGTIHCNGHRINAESARYLAKLLVIAAEIAEMEEDA